VHYTTAEEVLERLKKDLISQTKAAVRSGAEILREAVALDRDCISIATSIFSRNFVLLEASASKLRGSRPTAPEIKTRHATERRFSVRTIHLQRFGRAKPLALD